MGPGCQISSPRVGDGGRPRMGWGRGQTLPHPSVAPPNLRSLRESRRDRIRGWGVLSGHHHCHLEQGRGGIPAPGQRG